VAFKTELAPVPVGRLDDVWGYVEPRLGKVLEKVGADFVTSAVRRELDAGRVHLVVGLNGDVPTGFFVLSSYTDPYSGRVKLSVDIAFADPFTVDLAAVFQQIEELAGHVGADDLEWISPRTGWQKHMEAFDADAQFIIYSKAIT
jgi:hypothetical protein